MEIVREYRRIPISRTMTTRCKVCRDLNCVAVTHRFPITRCGNCDHITEEMSRAIDRRAFLCVRQSRDRARIARIESHSNDSFQLANERLKDVRKFAVAASAQCNALQTSLRRSYQSLYGESYPPLTDQEARSGVHHATPNDNSSVSERFVAPLFRTMGRPAP